MICSENNIMNCNGTVPQPSLLFPPPKVLPNREKMETLNSLHKLEVILSYFLTCTFIDRYDVLYSLAGNKESTYYPDQAIACLSLNHFSDELIDDADIIVFGHTSSRDG